MTLKPVMRVHQIDNINKALSFIQSRGIKIIGISAEDVVDRKPMLILSLLFTLAHQDSNKVQVEFMEWLNKVGVPCKNLTTEWRDGKNLCKLLNLLQTGIYQPTENAYQTIAIAMEIAEKNFGIPHILIPSDFQSETDTGVVLMYLNYYKKAYEELKINE